MSEIQGSHLPWLTCWRITDAQPEAACLVGYWVRSVVKLKAALVFSPHRAQHSVLGTTGKELALTVLLSQLALGNKVWPRYPAFLTCWPSSQLRGSAGPPTRRPRAALSQMLPSIRSPAMALLLLLRLPRPPGSSVCYLQPAALSSY